MEDSMAENTSSSSSFLKRKFKSMCGGCFNHHHHHIPPENRRTTVAPAPENPHSSEKPILRRSSSVGVNRTEDLKHKCRHLISRIGNHHNNNQHRKSHSTDFRYDPLSYSLNFDDDGGGDDGRFPPRNFADRLPPSPSPSRNPPPVEITAYS